MKKIVVTGSLAYDHLMTFDGEFKDSIVAGQLDSLSVSFLASSHKHGFGGCAGNIAYNLKMLGCEPVVLGVAGKDFGRYGEWMRKNGISTEEIFIDNEKSTASAYVLTDNRQRQISIFSPGAMDNLDDGLELSGVVNADDFACAIIAPEPPKRMVHFGRYFKRLGIPYIFDPGQAIPAFDCEEILELIEGAAGMIANEYEVEMLVKKLGMDFWGLVRLCGFLIKTTGEKGCEIYQGDDGVVAVPAIEGVEVVDVTGCGDAFRAGFISEYVEGKSLVECCKKGNFVASIALQQKGTQNHGL